MDEPRPRWKTALKVTFWVIFSIGVALWALIDWERAKWVVLYGSIALIVQFLWNDYQTEQAFYRKQFHDRLDRIERAILHLSNRLDQR